MGHTGSDKENQAPSDRVDGVKRLKQSTHLNMAACYLKQESFKKCVAACSKAMESSKTPSSKAYFRRGQAYVHLRDLDAAQEDFEKARELDPNDKAITAELQRLKAAFGKHKAA